MEDFDLEEHEDEGRSGEPLRRRDRKIDEARAAAQELLNRNRERVYYLRQIQVLLEKRFFHWIVGRAVGELVAEGRVGRDEVALKLAGTAKFVFHREHRYRKREIKAAVDLINKYSDPEVARACGDQAELLFLAAFAEKQFRCLGRNTRELGGRKWTRSEHTLDFIVERDAVVYGVEVKNSWDYIDKRELEVKLEICGALGLRPLFIMRQAAKSYIDEIVKQGGYAMIFEAHIFAYGASGLVQEIRQVFGLPCDSPRRIPEGILRRFVRWHERTSGCELGPEFTEGRV